MVLVDCAHDTVIVLQSGYGKMFVPYVFMCVQYMLGFIALSEASERIYCIACKYAHTYIQAAVYFVDKLIVLVVQCV